MCEGREKRPRSSVTKEHMMTFLRKRKGNMAACNLILYTIQVMINEKNVAFRHKEMYVLDLIKFNLL